MLALMLAWGLVFLVPLRWLRRLLGTVGAPSDLPGAVTDPRILARAHGVAWRIDRVDAGLPWHSTCLVRAVAGMLLLRRRGIGGAAIRFGVRKREGALEAHAWRLLGGTILLGGEEAANGYVPLADMTGRQGA